MTNKEIIKALMCFSFWHEGCNKCPHLKQCNKVKRQLTTYDTIDALNLINRQKAEIEALIAGQETLQKHIAEKDTEIERLKADHIVEVNKKVKEFAVRVKQEINLPLAVWQVFDNLAKEMVGEW